MEAPRVRLFAFRTAGAAFLEQFRAAFRVADAEGRTVPVGSEGEVIVSNLHNQATVLLNYRLGDRGALAAAPCLCGHAVVAMLL